MHELKIPEKLVAFVTLSLKETQVQLRIQSDFTEQLEMKNGGRQMDASAGILFNIAIEKVIRDKKSIIVEIVLIGAGGLPSLAKPIGNGPQSKPPLRRIYGVQKELKLLKVKNWKTLAKSRDAWKRLLEEVRTPQGCRAIEEVEKKKKQ
ncbi:hypothetical protein TNCV_4749891 [Trichonephila clavipes]|nr:hypothetical protein TNCV_4749891 [Trichonephila clavipes]